MFCESHKIDKIAVVGKIDVSFLPKLQNLIEYSTKKYEVIKPDGFLFGEYIFIPKNGKSAQLYIKIDKNDDEQRIKLEFNPSTHFDIRIMSTLASLLCLVKKWRYTRIDIAFDFRFNMSDYDLLPKPALTKYIYYGRNNQKQSIVLGTSKSDRRICLYNRYAKERIRTDKHWWRLEYQLKNRAIKTFFDEPKNLLKGLSVFSDYDLSVFPENERLTASALMYDKKNYQLLKSDYQRNKWRKKLELASDKGLTNQLQQYWNENYDEVLDELKHWISDWDLIQKKKQNSNYVKSFVS